MSDKPLISIITACSRPQNLPKLLQSILLLKNHKCIEWIIVHDSTFIPAVILDKKIEIKQIPQLTINGIAGSNQKAAGVKAANGEYLYFLDDDTILHHNFDKVINALKASNPDLLAFSQVLPNNTIRQPIFEFGKIDQAQYIFKAKWYLHTQGFVNKYEHDWLLLNDLLTINSNTFKIQKLPSSQPCCYYNKLR